MVEINDIIGKECTYYFSDDDLSFTDESTIKCKVTDININIDDKFPYKLNVGICLIPIEDHQFDDDELFEMQLGVSHDSVVFNL